MAALNRSTMLAATTVLASLCAGIATGGPHAIPAEVLARRTPGPRAIAAAGRADLGRFRDMFARAHAPGVSGQVLFVPRAGYSFASQDVAFDHGSPWEYDIHVPLVFYGPGIVRSCRIDAPARPYDLTATVAAALKTPPPAAATGKVWTQVFEEESPVPLAVLIVVMDQVGHADVERFRRDVPTLSRMIRQGAWFDNCRLDYLPSSTAVTHAAVGTGALPLRNGITANKIPKGGKMHIGLRGHRDALDPSRLQAPTLADSYDLRMGNAPVVISHVYADYAACALAGHGTLFPGGDRDIVVYYDTRTGEHLTDPRYFRIPDYIAKKEVSRLWGPEGLLYHGLQIGSPSNIRMSPAFARFQAGNVLEMMAREGVGNDDVPDLVLANLKSTDTAGHFLGHDHPAYRENLMEIDRFLRLAEKLLGRRTGRGGYLIAITADHGLAPEDSVRVDRDAWGRELGKQLDLSGDRDGRSAVIGVEPGRVFLDEKELAEEGATIEAVRDRVRRDPRVLAAWTDREIAERALELYEQGDPRR